jgi:multimeric flavodoxin WrbA
MLRILVIAGSQRRQYNCPGVDGKARTFLKRMVRTLEGEFEIDEVDLANVYAAERIQPCNACVSTSMALCVWPCNCYEKNNKDEPDLMWNLDLYARLDLADAWAVIGPVNWYGPSSNLKAMFDRLVCANGGNPREELIEHKNPELAMALEHTDEWRELSVNHLEGRTAAFYCYGDGGGDELERDGRPKKLRHKEWFDPKDEPFANGRDAFAPLVWQCRYSGVEVPDALWHYTEFGNHKPYSDNQAEDIDDATYFEFDAWTQQLAHHVREKGKVPPGRWRAYGYEPPKHRWADLKLAWRDRKMRFGKPPAGSSVEAQQQEGLNDDITLRPKAGK